jgi:hypothetical protein
VAFAGSIKVAISIFLSFGDIKGSPSVDNAMIAIVMEE